MYMCTRIMLLNGWCTLLWILQHLQAYNGLTSDECRAKPKNNYDNDIEGGCGELSLQTIATRYNSSHSDLLEM